MIRRGVKLQLLVFAVLTAVGVVYTGLKYVGLGDKLINPPYTVAADFADSGGIFSNAEVTYRGLSVGRVGNLELTDDGVLVNLEIEEGVEVPADTRAVVANLSAVGEQYVDLRPNRDDGPMLADGSTIPRGMTGTPLPVEDLLLNLDKLVTSVDIEDLQITIEELGKAFSGTGPQLQRLIDEGNELTNTASAALPETLTLITDGRTVLDTQRDARGNITDFARDLALFTDQLVESDGDIRAVFDNGVPATQELADLFDMNRENFPRLLGNLITLGQIQEARLPGLEQVLITYPGVVAGGYTVAPGDGTAHFGMVMRSDFPICTEGYDTDRRDPLTENEDIPANSDVDCALPPESGAVVRGGRNAPLPNTDGRPQPSGGADSVAFGGGSGQSQAQTYMAAYDPRTGTAVGPGGQRVTMGATGGQAQLLGDESWRMLLMGPMSG